METAKDAKNRRLAEIKHLIHGFCEEYLNPELEGYCLKLCDTLGRKRTLNISKSKSEQWAASIVYVIARLNFLFDKQNEYFITADEICDFFGTKKSTTSNKATQIEQSCGLSMGEEGYCSRRISDMFVFYQTESGFVIPKYVVDRLYGEAGTENESDAKEVFPKSRGGFGRKEKSDSVKVNKKPKNENKDQMGLF